MWNFSEELKLKEMEEKVTPDAKTKQVLLSIMNSVCRDLTWTAESQEDFPDGFLPTLDKKLQLVNNQIIYKFYVTHI